MSSTTSSPRPSPARSRQKKRSTDGVPVEPYTLRVTHVYRREHGEWKIVHRHGDYRDRNTLE